MRVHNSKAMCVLLEALEIQKCDLSLKGDWLIIEITRNELAYYINSADESIQHIYGQTPEWQELLQLAFDAHDDLAR